MFTKHCFIDVIHAFCHHHYHYYHHHDHHHEQCHALASCGTMIILNILQDHDVQQALEFFGDIFNLIWFVRVVEQDRRMFSLKELHNKHRNSMRGNQLSIFIWR